MDMPLVPSKASPGDDCRMKARGWPKYRPLPTISLYSLMPVALVSTHPELVGINRLRLVMTPSRQRKAWFVPERVAEVPTIHAWSLRALEKELFVGLSSVPRSSMRRLVGSVLLLVGSFHAPLDEVTRKACCGNQVLVTPVQPVA